MKIKYAEVIRKINYMNSLILYFKLHALLFLNSLGSDIRINQQNFY